jgi:hypothetical protein
MIPTTIGALLSAIGIAGMDRLVRRNTDAAARRRERMNVFQRRKRTPLMNWPKVLSSFANSRYYVASAT